MRAAEGGHTTVVQFLTDGCKADVNASNKNGYTALIWAARRGQDEVVRYLAERRGVEVDARDKNGYTALMKVCKGGNIKVLRALAAAGADVNGSDDFGYTALMIASGCGHIDIVRFLVEECHVVVNSRNNRGETAVRVASDCGNSDVERYLTPFLLHSPPSYVSAATSTAENDVLETQTMSIPPSEVEPIDFSTSSSIGPNYHRVKWLEADACVKLLRPDSDHSSLEKEVHLWQGLRHPHVMNFYGVCDSVPQLQLFVCEYSSKGTLLDHVKSDSVERSSVWRNLHEAAVGLAYLHKQGIVHGDLRCSNILISNDGIAKLCNVELSGLLKKSSDASAGANGFVRWQAPEVLRGEKLSFQSDVYSLGMCILEAVTREMSWEDCASDNAVTDRKLRWAPESTVDENLEPRCPLGDAKTLVWCMCCQDPDKRASLASVVCGLERLAVEEDLDPEPDLPFDFYNFHDEFMRKLWWAVYEKMTVFYHDAFDEIKKV